jgi:hypothetical protein
MKINKNYWLAASGALAVASALMLFSARRIEAQFSSPVRVMNTSAAPAITSRIDDPGRIAYRSGQFPTISPPTTAFESNFPTVPANHRLVVQHIGGIFFVSNNGTALVNGISSSFFVQSQFGAAAFDQSVLYYWDAGATPQIGVQALNGQTFSGQQAITMTGYLLDCSAAPCSPIAQ